jgi:hypothetical protein
MCIQITSHLLFIFLQALSTCFLFVWKPEQVTPTTRTEENNKLPRYDGLAAGEEGFIVVCIVMAV